MIRRVVYLSYHTSPLSQPGIGDAGGMNVYLDELAHTMAGRGVGVDVFTRRANGEQSEVVEVTDGYRVIQVPAGPEEPLPAGRLSDYVFDFAEWVIEFGRGEGYDLVHSHYWLSGWAGLMVKRVLGLPLANSFHTLGRAKGRAVGAAPPSLLRIAAEKDVIAGSDCVVAATPAEADDLVGHYGARPTRLRTSPPGIDHVRFSPGDQARARRRVGIDHEGPIILWVGRIQELKGPETVVEAFGKIRQSRPDVHLMVIGGPSGPDGVATEKRVRKLASRHAGAVHLLAPQAHAEMAHFYRSADVLLMPSHSESFGLVAAEAQACAIPVVASSVGGLVHSVSGGSSGLLVEGTAPEGYAEAALRILNDKELALRLRRGAVRHAARYSWDATAERLLELYDGISI